MAKGATEVEKLIKKVVEEVRNEGEEAGEPAYATKKIDWPVDCRVGPGLEGAIACETNIGYVNGSKGRLIYQGYDLFDLCEKSNFEEVSYLLLNGKLPTEKEYESFTRQMKEYRHLPNTQRMMMGFPLESMHPMAALRLGTDLMRRRLTWRDSLFGRPSLEDAIAADEDSIPMETLPMGERRAIYEFRKKKRRKPAGVMKADDAQSLDSCIHLVSGLATLAAGIARVRDDKLPIEPDSEMGHAANLLYMMTGKEPTREEERIMDIALILHADHGMNASTFASMVVASTMSDIYSSVGAGIGALSGPLHGGANEQVLQVLQTIGSTENVEDWYAKTREQGAVIPGFGHRVYKTYDPRARVLAPLARYLARKQGQLNPLYEVALKLEQLVISTLGKEKGVFPNVDFYSGLVYSSMGIPPEMFTPIFAVSRVSGWTARVSEYLRENRIFRPRAIYVGSFDKEYVEPKDR